MVNYVASHLGSSRGLLSRAATRDSIQSRDGFTPEEFAAADAAIQEMKQVIYDMVVKSETSASALTQYVTKYKSYVVNALKMADRAVSEDTSVEDLITEFTTFKTEKSLTSANVLEFGDTFDANFGITKHRLNEVKLKDTGTDAFFKFTLDNTGRIASVDLMENPMAEYGSSWTVGDNQKKIVIEGVDAVIKTNQGLNPFGTDGDYRMGEAGVLNRTGNGSAFTNTIHHYKFNLGEHNIAGAAIDEDEFKDVDINSDTVLDLPSAKQKLKDYIIEKVNKKLHNQDSEDEEQLDKFLAVANWYIDAIDALTVVPNYEPINQTATMNGMGKDVQLKYSDFGYAKMVRHTTKGDESQYVTYVGGYDQRRMDNTPANNSLEDGATFTGTGIVTVEDHHKNTGTGADTRHTALYKDTSAQLRYNVVDDKAQHTLTMENLKAVAGDETVTLGSDWYEVVVQGTQDNPTMNITFDATGKTIDSGFQFFRADAEGNITRNNALEAGNRIVNTSGTEANAIDMIDGTSPLGGGDNHKLNGSASAEYYGQDKTNPTEATSGFWMDERWHSGDSNIQHEVSVYGAFGGQKD